MIRSVSISILSCIVFFGLGELGSRVWITHRGDALDVTRTVLQADAQLGWKTRANLDTTFLRLPLYTDARGWRTQEYPSAHASTSILLLGPSSAFGWGVRAEDTYAMRLQSLLSSSSVNVYNASVIGYSSDQGKRLFTSLGENVHPRIVIVAYGVNDLDRSRFYFQSTKSDAQEFVQPEPTSSVEMTNAIYSSALFELLLKGAHGLLAHITPAQTVGDNPVPVVRDSVEDFTQNMRAIVRTAKERGEKVIVLTTVSNLPTSAPVPAAEALYEQGLALWKKGDHDDAKKLFAQSVAIDPHENEAFYYLGDIAQARANEPYRISRDIPLYNTALKSVAAEEHVPVGDIDTWFGEAANRASLFVDPIHFSPLGNRLVALGLADIIRKNNLLYER